MKARINTRVAGYNGVCAGINFVNGYAEADINDRQYEYFKSANYKMILLEMPNLSTEEKPAKVVKRRKKNAK